MKTGENFVLGLDFGTDSCRAVIFDAANGSEAGSSVAWYPRWAKGLYCDPAANKFRQHPLDYLETLEEAVNGAVEKTGYETAAKIRGIGVDTTGSTPCAVDRTGTPLSLKKEFAENPAAMFVLWKDHSAIAEADRINEVNRAGISNGDEDYLRLNGGIFSSEWFWAKVLRVMNEDQKVSGEAVSFIEHCEWLSALLSGTDDIKKIKRNRCSMSLRALWHAEFGGYPPKRWFEKIDPRLVPVLDSMGNECWPADTVAGNLSSEWAARLKLPSGIPVTLGAIDAHIGGVGGGVEPGRMVMVVGTSTCNILVGPKTADSEKAVRGICGQEEGSVIPGMTGYEAGQSAFGDIYAWFRDLLLWPFLENLPGADNETLRLTLAKKIIPELEKAAENVEPGAGGLLALDWHNGRRTPDVNAHVCGAILGLNLGTDAPKMYRSLVEATAFGARAIVERFRDEGIPVNEINAVGGVARKSSLVTQILADVINMPIRVLAADQAVALGAAMFAAVAAGLYKGVPAAQKGMEAPVEKIYMPGSAETALYDTLYRRYRELGNFVEGIQSC
jgi:L-ribulokinase